MPAPFDFEVVSGVIVTGHPRLAEGFAGREMPQTGALPEGDCFALNGRKLQ
jgi:hypothetical protein